VSGAADPALVRAEYATEERFMARRADRRGIFLGPDPREHALLALLEVRPSRVLDAGCGTGDFTESVAAKLGCDVVGIDLSQRMVELTRARGLEALVGDARELPFADSEFDAIAANWMLYHLPDLDAGLAELQRVLRPGGRLVAITNGRDHLAEVWGQRSSAFDDHCGAAALERHFHRVAQHDISGRIVFATREGLAEYVGGFSCLRRNPVRPLETFSLPLEASTRHSVFVADKAP
jgi:SAM-dependent methyltransferase